MLSSHVLYKPSTKELLSENHQPPFLTGSTPGTAQQRMPREGHPRTRHTQDGFGLTGSSRWHRF